jgi:phospholipid/cholesterol/gamma-HCH transport system substrate-binding protein
VASLLIRLGGVFGRRAPRQNVEIAVGALAILGVALALWLASAGGKAARANDGYVLTARFDQVDGLAVGSPVYVAGIQVGTVLRVDLAPGTFKPLVSLSVRRGITIPTDSAALVMSDGVLGGKFIRIEPGSETEAMKAGDRFGTVQDSVIVEALLQKIIQGAEARRRGQAPESSPDARERRPDAPEKKPGEAGPKQDEQKQ